mmetsp:Transcript_100422/g.284412  ORF Transcript_100422/g.284412 Transcript_100422/m.284412 type:complete len:287 (+) Transcript_100422:1090-1950(+)
MVPEDARDARVRQDVGVPDQHLVAWERPVSLGAACVVVVNECDRVRRHPAQEPRRLPCSVAQPPVLAVVHRLLQDALGSEVKGSGGLAGSLDPVAEVLPVFVLIVAQAFGVVLHVAPQLAHRPRGLALLAVPAHVLGAVALDKVKAPRVEADLQPQPTQPDGDALLNLLVGVVDVGGRVEPRVVVPRGILASAIRELVAQGHCPALPVHDPGKAGPCLHAGSEYVPAALAVLLVPAPVIDHNIRHAPHARSVQLAQQRLQGGLRAVLGVIKVEELRRQVALRRHRL